MSEIYLRIKADVGDADYLYSFNKLDKADVKLIEELATVMKEYGAQNRYKHNWDEEAVEVYKTKYNIPQDTIELVSECLPYLDNHEVHSINKFAFVEVDTTRTLTVKI